MSILAVHALALNKTVCGLELSIVKQPKFMFAVLFAGADEEIGVGKVGALHCCGSTIP